MALSLVCQLTGYDRTIKHLTYRNDLRVDGTTR